FGLVPRALTAGWFATTALVPVAAFFIFFGRWNHVDSLTLWEFIELPVASAVLLGFLLGVRILRPEARAGRSVFLGIGVAVLSYVAYGVSFLPGFGIGRPPGIVHNLGGLVVVLLIGLIFVGGPLLLAGA